MLKTNCIAKQAQKSVQENVDSKHWGMETTTTNSGLSSGTWRCAVSGDEHRRTAHIWWPVYIPSAPPSLAPLLRLHVNTPIHLLLLKTSAPKNIAHDCITIWQIFQVDVSPSKDRWILHDSVYPSLLSRKEQCHWGTSQPDTLCAARWLFGIWYIPGVIDSQHLDFS